MPKDNAELIKKEKVWIDLILLNMNRTPRAFEQIMGGSKSSVPLSHSTPNMDRPPAF